jgi:ABA4-like protein
MTAAQVFIVANLFALAGWVILVIAIALQRSWLRDTVAGIVWPVLLSVLYVIASGLGWGTSGGGFLSLVAVREHLSGNWPMLAAWVHYLAFDLFIGARIAAETERAQLPRLILVPVLPLTYLYGPAGLLLFYILRQAAGRPRFSSASSATPPAARHSALPVSLAPGGGA